MIASRFNCRFHIEELIGAKQDLGCALITLDGWRHVGQRLRGISQAACTGEHGKGFPGRSILSVHDAERRRSVRLIVAWEPHCDKIARRSRAETVIGKGRDRACVWI
jgi:hypothetical protein